LTNKQRVPSKNGTLTVSAHAADNISDKGEGVLQMRTSAIFGTKNFWFFWDLWCVL